MNKLQKLLRDNPDKTWKEILSMLKNVKYISIREVGNDEASNVGVISTNNLSGGFKKAVEAHFDATLGAYEFDGGVTSLKGCVDSYPVNVAVRLYQDGDMISATLELSQTWIYD